jgi:hypothetical protein
MITLAEMDKLVADYPERSSPGPLKIVGSKKKRAKQKK